MANQIVQQITAELETLQKELENFKNITSYLNGGKEQVENAVKTVHQAEANFDKRIKELKETYESIINLKGAIGETIKKIDSVNFPERLDSIEKAVNETITTLNNTRQATIDELQKASETINKADFEGQFLKLQAAIDASIKANESLKKSILDEDLGGKIKRGYEENLKKVHEEFLQFELSINEALKKNKDFLQELNLPTRMDKLDANISGILSAVQNTQARLDTVERNLGDKIKDGFEKQAQTFSNLQIQIQQNHDILLKKQQINAYVTWALVTIGCIAVILLT